MNAFVTSLSAQFARLGMVAPQADPIAISRILRTSPTRVLDAFAHAGPTISDQTRAFTSLVLQQPEVPTPVVEAIDRHWVHRAAESTIDLTAIMRPIADVFVEAGMGTFLDSPVRGGQFLLRPVNSKASETLRTPEDLSVEAREIGRTVEAFLRNRVQPHRGRIEAKDYAFQRELMREAAELGILGAEIPEPFGGLGISTEIWTAMMEAMGFGVDSFIVGMTGHMGIGTHPIIKYGSDSLKAEYLPKMATGEWLGAYALTEPNAGSDALGGMKATAALSEDGQYWILNGSKCFITNAGFADVFTVFAKVDGKPSAFVVDRNTEGFSIGGEEHKLGLKGSSTCTIHFDNAKIPRGHLLGEIGQGAKIALNILNTGRLRIGIICTGSAMKVVGLAAQYAATRQQFRQPIASFGAVQVDLAEAAIRAFVSQSMTHRIAGDVGVRIGEMDAEDPSGLSKVAKVAEEFSIESSIAKIFGSEAYNIAVDRFVQIMGGYGYIENEDDRESAASLYRDARINEIFEGTNGINRVHQVTGALLRRMNGGLVPTSDYSRDHVQLRLAHGDAVAAGHPLQDAILQAHRAQELTGYLFKTILDDPELLDLVTNPRNPRSNDLGQQIALGLSELAIAAYAMSSSVLRALKLSQGGDTESAPVALAMARTFAHEEFRRAMGLAGDLMDTISGGNEMLHLLEYRSRLNVAKAKSEIAAHFVQAGRYDLR